MVPDMPWNDTVSQPNPTNKLNKCAPLPVAVPHPRRSPSLHAEHLRAVVRLRLARSSATHQRVVQRGILQLRVVRLQRHADHCGLPRKGADGLALEHVHLTSWVDTEVENAEVAAAQRLVRELRRLRQLGGERVVQRCWANRPAIRWRLLTVGREEFLSVWQSLLVDSDLVSGRTH